MVEFEIRLEGNYTAYRIEINDQGERTEVCLGLVHQLSPEIIAEMDDYYSKKDAAEEKKYSVYGAIRNIQERIITKSRSFGQLWVIHQIEKRLGVIPIIDSEVAKNFVQDNIDQGEKNDQAILPSVGFYFFIDAAYNITSPVFKNELCDWVKGHDLEHIVGKRYASNLFNAENYAEQYDKVTYENVKNIFNSISKSLFSNINFPNNDCVLFFYTLEIKNTSNLLPESVETNTTNSNGKSSKSKNIRLLSLINPVCKTAFYHKIYQGDIYNLNLFDQTMAELSEHLHQCGDKTVTFLFNRPDFDSNIKIIDKYDNIHFLATYQIENLPQEYLEYFDIDLANYELIDCKPKKDTSQDISKAKPKASKNKASSKNPDDQNDQTNQKPNKDIKQAISRDIVFLDQPRKLVIIFNNTLYKNQQDSFDDHIKGIEEWLEVTKKQIMSGKDSYQSQEEIIADYQEVAKGYIVPVEAFKLNFIKQSLNFSYAKQEDVIAKSAKQFGKIVLISDRVDLNTAELVNIYVNQSNVSATIKDLRDNVYINSFSKDEINYDTVSCCILATTLRLQYLHLITYILRQNSIRKQIKDVFELLSDVKSISIHYIGLPSLNSYTVTDGFDTTKITASFEDEALNKFFASNQSQPKPGKTKKVKKNEQPPKHRKNA